ncbi:multidrug effflux MFS transporter [Roseinatronobacter sp. NSM]|uniref:multidrug effflux MFS transporter n=1 Tax=Roseinatronobacter sp. NSM TaxID=3457785 RepID=UPI00403577EB
MMPFTPTKPLRFGEFVALMALMSAMVAFSIDAMLPALPVIGVELSPAVPTRGQLVIPAFMLGLGLGILVCGPVSDAYGRKSVLLVGLVLYIGGALLASKAATIEGLLGARVLQGLGAAAPRVVATAMVRDLYQGRAMARVTSIIMTLFVLFPAIAPSIGAGIILLADWRAIFYAFVVLGLVSGVWLMLRQPESLPPARRRALSLRAIGSAIAEITTNRTVMVYVGALIFSFAPLFTWLSNLPVIFDDVYDRAASFPLWFGATALIAGSASMVNAQLVMRMGMRKLATFAFGWQVAVSALFVVLLQIDLPDPWNFGLFFAFMCSTFFTIGLTFGNLNALALQPLGHIAGIGASVVMSISTIGAVAVSVPVALAYDGTPLTLVAGNLAFAGCALGLVLYSRRFAAADMA